MFKFLQTRKAKIKALDKTIKKFELLIKQEFVELYFVGQAKDFDGNLIGCYAAKEEGNPLQVSIYNLNKLILWRKGGATWLELNEVK